MAGWNAITGARGIVAAFLMSALLQVGVLDVTTALLGCTATSAIGVALFVQAGRRQATTARAPEPALAALPQAGTAVSVART
jgi:hypothetical protein